jgi:hypothetical protein
MIEPLHTHQNRIISSGPFVITWNLAKAKKGNPYCYEIKEYGDNVIAESFKYGEDKHLIVALPNDITAVTKNKFSTPERMLGTPKNVKFPSQSHSWVRYTHRSTDLESFFKAESPVSISHC